MFVTCSWDGNMALAKVALQIPRTVLIFQINFFVESVVTQLGHAGMFLWHMQVGTGNSIFFTKAIGRHRTIVVLDLAPLAK